MLFGVLRLRQEIKETDGRSLMSQNMNALYYVWRFCPVVHAHDQPLSQNMKRVFLTIDLASNTIARDPQATRMLARTSRPPFEF